MAVLSSEKAIRSIGKTGMLLRSLLDSVTTREALDATDGPAGWNPLFIVCHLRDYEEIFLERVRRSVEEDVPRLPFSSNDELILRNDYAAQDFKRVCADLLERRQVTLAYSRTLTEEQWARTGIHPVWGENSALHYAVNIALHDIDHAGQLTNLLTACRGARAR